MICSIDPVHTLPVFEDRFTSNDLNELLSFFQPKENAADVDEPREPVSSSRSGSDNSTNPDPDETDEKINKRKISNRESARRSRLRKKRYEENLMAHANRLKAQNREYMKRFSAVLDQLNAVRRQNELFRFESACLIRRHVELNRVLQFMRYSKECKKNVWSNGLSCGQFMDGNEVLLS